MMEDNGKPTEAFTFRREIPSAAGAVALLLTEIREVVEGSLQLGRDQLPVLIAIEEAVVNAGKHGNGGHATKEVIVDMRFEGARLVIQVEDEGEVFDESKVPNPLAPENLEKPSGRGLFLIRQYMERVLWYPRGVGGKGIRMERTIERPQTVEPAKSV